MATKRVDDTITFDWLEKVVRGFSTAGMVGGVMATDWRVTVHKLPSGRFAVNIVGEDGVYANATCETRTQFVGLCSVVGMPLRGVSPGSGTEGEGR